MLTVFEEWERERKPKVAGVITSLLLKSVDVRYEFAEVAVF